MSIRNKIAKSLRSGFAGVALCGTIVSAPLVGGYAWFDSVTHDFDGTNTVESQEKFEQYDQRIKSLKKLYEEWGVMADGAKEQDTPAQARAFLAEKDKVEVDLMQDLEKLSADILTDTKLSEVDYESLDRNFFRLERMSIDGSAKFYLPKEHNAYKEIQQAVLSDKTVTGQFAAAQQIRTEMNDAYTNWIGAPIGLATFFGLFFSCCLVGDGKPHRKLADAVAKKKPMVKRGRTV